MNKITARKTRSRFLSMIAWPVALMASLGLASVAAAATDSLQVKNEIIDLMLCYGKGTDTFGVASNPDSYADGLATYRECFTEDATFNFWPPGTDFLAPAPINIIGPVNWANFVASGLTGNSLGQHMLSNFMVETQGNTGTLTAYLHATRATYAPGGAVTNVAVANGTYTLHVEKIQKKWMVRQLNLTLISFADHFTAAE